MSYYETIFIARQDVSAAQVDGLADAFSQIVTDAGGTIHRREYWGLKALSFRINKNRKGHYVLLNIDADSAPMREMERQIRLNEDVLRYMTIRTETLPEGPSVAMQGRDHRERAQRDGGDRGDRGDRAPRGDRFEKPEIEKPAVEKPAEEPTAGKPTEEPAAGKPAEEPTAGKPAEELETAGDKT